MTTIIMFAMSWASLDFQEYGLDYNGWRQTVTVSAAGSGRYFLGLGHEFLVFPKVYQTIEYRCDLSHFLLTLRSLCAHFAHTLCAHVDSLCAHILLTR